jgi:dienelactone hydrolase
MTDDRLDSLSYTLARYREVSPRMAFRAEDIPAWKANARARLRELLGPLPADRVPLDPKYGEAKARPGHTRIPVTFATRAGLDAFGFLLIPDGVKSPAPAVICLPGHGRGVEDLVGIAEDGTDRDHDDGYQHDFAVQSVRQGYVTLALELLGFGRRRDPAARKAGSGHSSCQPSAGAALMLGETMVGWRVWDTLRAIDLLETRPEVDPKRIALMGISGGGTVILYASALDERVKVSVLSCSFCTFKDSIYSVSHCIDNYVPGILRDFEVADLTGLIAPRALFAENGLDDPIFPASGVREALRATRRVYEAHGAADRLGHAFFEGGHVFHGADAFEKLRDWL